MIDISKLDKAEALAALFNASKQQGMGFLNVMGKLPMSKEEAKRELDDRAPELYFDYLHGRVMKVDLRGETLDPCLYDRDNGKDAAQRALQPLLDAVTA